MISLPHPLAGQWHSDPEDVEASDWEVSVDVEAIREVERWPIRMVSEPWITAPEARAIANALVLAADLVETP